MAADELPKEELSIAPVSEDKNLFDGSSCPIQPVPEVNFEFIPQDIACVEAPEPLPIFTCIQPIIPPEPPTDVGVECPVFPTIETKIDVGYRGGTGECYIDDEPRARITVNKTNVDPCEYALEFDLSIPIPRPGCITTLQAGSINTNIGFDYCVPPGSRFSITKETIPAIDCNSQDECVYTIALDINIPIPRPTCPNIKTTGVNVDVNYPQCLSSYNELVVEKRIIPGDCSTPEQCEYDIGLNLAIPLPETLCPVIRVDNFSSTAFYGGTADCDGTNQFTITTKRTEGDCDSPPLCEFAVSLDIFVPLPRPPCPEININTFSVNTGFSRCLPAGENRFVITPKYRAPENCFDPGTCSFDLELVLTIPVPEPQCPIINVLPVNLSTGLYSENQANPICSRPTTFSVTTRKEPGDCITPDQCLFDLALDIFIPIPRQSCPTLVIDDVSVGVGYRTCLPNPRTIFKVNRRHVPATGCDDLDKCEFGLTLILDIPIPVPECPTLYPGFTQVVSGFQTTGGVFPGTSLPCSNSSGQLFIIKEEIPGTCDTPPRCAFRFDLEVLVATPRTPCPIIQAGDFIVRPGLVGGNLNRDCIGEDNRFQIRTENKPGLTYAERTLKSCM